MTGRFKNGVAGTGCWAVVCAVVVASVLTAPAYGTASRLKRKHPQAAASTSSAHKRKSHHRRHYYRRQVGQKAPTPDRIKDIQSALAREGYYQGQPTGRMDSTTIDSLEKFQSAHGLDASGKLDAPTLQKMGLGSDVAGVSPPKAPPPPSCCSGSTPATKPALDAAPRASTAATPARASGETSAAVSASNATPAAPEQKASTAGASSPGNTPAPSNSSPSSSSHSSSPN
ncbi:MAG TPA: peptidoglycan-binding protein [Verrucomicrobiae bacterium]|nr:peptidoglycan-binding protein [Verrucomicrobiae bacterium]